MALSQGMARGAGGGRGAHIYFLAALIDGVTPSLAAMGKNLGAFKMQMAGWEAYAAAALTGVNKALQAAEAAAVGAFAGMAVLGAGYAMAAKQTMNFEQQLINMHSIMAGGGGTIDQMWSMGDVAVGLSLKFNKSADEIAAGLYHLASAGLSYQEILSVIQPTVELSVATQGDYVKIAKDVVQVIKGFGMEMSQANEVADVMAYTIQHSLVTWDKLGEGIKFAMPWFTAAGMEFEELAAAIGLLTDRALEAGIGGRGMRQFLAMLIRDVVENKDKFDELGISVIDSTGNIKSLLEIVKEFKTAFPEMNVDAISTMMEMLGIRGATAFAHLVAGSEEFESKLVGIQSATGTASEIAETQMQAASARMERLKNLFLAPFKTEEFAEQIGMLITIIKPLISNISPMLASLMFYVGEMFKIAFTNGLPFMNLLANMVVLIRTFVNIMSAGNGQMMKFAYLMILLTKVGRLNQTMMSAQIMLQKQAYINQQREIVATYQSAAAKAGENTQRGAGLLLLAEEANAKLMNAQATQHYARAQMTANAAISVGMAAIWMFAEGQKEYALALTAVAGILAAVTVLLALKNALDYKAHPIAALAIAGVVAAGTMALLATVGMKMSGERAKMEADMAQMSADIEASRAAAQPAGAVGFGGGAVPVLHEGGHVTEEGYAYLDEGETILPSDFEGGMTVVLDLRNSVVTNDAAKTLVKEASKQFAKDIYNKKRMRKK